MADDGPDGGLPSRPTFADLVADGSILVEGDTASLVDFFGLLDTFEFWFDIVTP